MLKIVVDRRGVQRLSMNGVVIPNVIKTIVVQNVDDANLGEAIVVATFLINPALNSELIIDNKRGVVFRGDPVSGGYNVVYEDEDFKDLKHMEVTVRATMAATVDQH